MEVQRVSVIYSRPHCREGWSQESTLLYLLPTGGLLPLDCVGHLPRQRGGKKLDQHVKELPSSRQREPYTQIALTSVEYSRVCRARHLPSFLGMR